MMLLFAIAGSGYGAYWYFVTTQLEAAVDGWFTDWRRAGHEATYMIAGTEGFPMISRLRLVDIRLADPGKRWKWHGAEATLEIQPWKPNAYRLALFGPQQVTLPIAGQSVDTVTQAGEAVGIARTDLTGRLRYAGISLNKVSIEAPALGQRSDADRLGIELDFPENPPVRHDEPFAALQIMADGVTLPTGYHGPLGEKLSRLSSRFVLQGPIARGDTEAMLTRWRDSGGVLEMPWLKLDWGPLRMEGNGTMALDGFLRPEGAVAAKVRGIDGAIDSFASAGLIDRTTSKIVSAGLQLLAIRPDDGSEPYVSIPLEAQDGALYFGPLKIADLVPVIPKRTDIDRAAPAPIPSVNEAETLPAPAE